jgi:hypothetical protein
VSVPGVASICQEDVHEGGLDRRPEDIRAHARAVHKQDGALVGRAIAAHVNEMSLNAVVVDEWNHTILGHAISLPSRISAFQCNRPRGLHGTDVPYATVKWVARSPSERDGPILSGAE